MAIKLILHHVGAVVRVIKKMRDRDCFWWEDRCECSLKNGGYVIGWFGVIYRSAAIFTLAVLIPEMEDEDDYVRVMLLSILLTYFFISLAANFLLIVGLSKKHPNYLLPYLGIYGVEILVLLASLLGGIILIVKMVSARILYYFVPCGLLIIGSYAYCWSLLVRLFHEFRQASVETSSLTSQLSDCGYVKFRCSCFKSDSLYVVT
ncbi:hypothetical protein Zmor_027442 [Zophobas morio]|uniref:Uncharacterized protein n=1 Tax=Zophobas morio TaxID=2755281 RepID=A0AA38HPD5_9CUCU|nr:hypothetical protein Zmor_027442 [Zophobas morio]